MDKLSNMMGGGRGESDSSNMMEDLDASCTCSRKTRLYGFCICTVIGFLISFFVRGLFSHFHFSELICGRVMACASDWKYRCLVSFDTE
jgi:hypothetical protein